MTQNNGENIDFEQVEISLKEIILKIKSWKNYILSKWVIIFLIGISGGALGLAYAYFKKPTYKAELSFALQGEKSSGGLGGAFGVASQLGIDLGGSAGGEFSGDNLLELMRSRNVMEKALLTPITVHGKTETLAEFYINFNNIRTNWEGNVDLKNLHFLPGIPRERFTIKQDSVLGVFYKSLVANNVSIDKIDKKLSIISLKVSTTNELFSKYFAEVLAKVVSDFYVQTKTKREVKNVAILQRQADSVRRELYGAISGVASSIDAAPNPNPSFQSLRVPSQRKQVEVVTTTAVLTELVRNLEAAKMSLLQETPLIQEIDKPILPLEKNGVGKLRGLIYGGVLFGFLAIVFLTIKKIWDSLLS
jgi:hypothetical protein